jgi:ribonucleotide reductase alpha subunit
LLTANLNPTPNYFYMFFFRPNAELDQLKAAGEAPEWMRSEGYATLFGSAGNTGYLMENETPKGLYTRLSSAAAKYLNRPDLEPEFFRMLWRGWLGGSSPVLSNFGAERGLPIACFGAYTPDTMSGIIDHITEQSRLTWHGGGVSSHLNDLRAIGAPIKSGGVSDGILSPLRMLNATVPTISQNSMRRGSLAAYLNIDHPDIQTFLRMRQPEVDEDQRFLKLHHGVCITEDFTHRLKSGEEAAAELWNELLTLRMETGEPYLIFEAAANRDNPPAYARLGLKVNGSNLCCLEADTVIVTRTGNVTISSILNQSVEIWDGVAWAETVFEYMGDTSELIKVEFADGTDIQVTPAHRFPTATGAMIYAWALSAEEDTIVVETSNLQNTQEVRGEIVNVSIVPLTEPQPMYCCTVPSSGIFALADGRMTGNSEIFLATSPEYTFVCCLSSLNLAAYDEWKNENIIELAIYFLDAVMSEFIERASKITGLENAVRFATKSRALGLGVLGYQTYLQSKSIAFDSPAAHAFNLEVFAEIRYKAEAASIALAKAYGKPEWCVDLNRRHTHLLALAPTLTNSIICAVSRGIEPYEVNAGFTDGAKGNFTFANEQLIPVLEKYGYNTDITWRSIAAHSGSVQHLEFMSDHDKSVFKTAREIDQRVLVTQAIERGQFIDQGQSLNLFYEPDADPSDVHAAHWLAYTGVNELPGLKSLYYLKTASKLKTKTQVNYNLTAPAPGEECKVCQ